MGGTVTRAIGTAAAAAMLAGATAPSAAQTGRKATTAAEANAQSARDQQLAIAAAAAAKAEQDARAARLANETPAERKAREKAEKAAAKAEAKRVAGAEQAGRPKKSKAAVNCVAGAVVGVFAVLLTHKKSAGNILAGAAGGCVGGWALGEALKGKDEDHLNHYIADEYIERDDIGTTGWNAPESGQVINVEKVGESYKTVQQSVSYDPSLTFDAANIRVSVRKMRATKNVSLRAMPMAGAEVIGSFGAGEIVQAYGDTNDLQWTYLAERQADGRFLLIGYVPAADLNASLALPGTQQVVVAKPKPPVKVAHRTPTRRGVRAAAVAAAPMPATSVAPRTVSFAAVTRCKNIRVSAMGKAGATQERCGGAANVA